MEMRTADKIDRYLRNEMTDKELQQFEQQAMNDVKLHREVELVYVIKRGLAARQEKLKRMREWSKNRRYTLWRYGVAASVAAVAVGVLVSYMHSGAEGSVADNAVTVAGVPADRADVAVRDPHADGVTARVAKVVDNGADSAGDTDKGQSSAVERKMMALHSGASNVEHDYMSVVDYERDWKQILSLLHKDNYAELIPLLEAYVQISGKHQSAADSLLQRCQGRANATLKR